MTDILVSVESPLWEPAERWQPLVTRAASAALAHAWPWAEPLRDRAELSLLLTDDAGIRALNRDWRGRDRPTNVLAFPMLDADAAPDGPDALLLGDVVLAHETSAREAEASGMALDHHVAHLVVHGVLHLLGHDHEEDAEAERMEALETLILGALAMPDPHARHRQAA